MKYILLVLSALSILLSMMLFPRVHFSIGFQLHLALSIIAFIYALFWKNIPRKVHITLGLLCLIPLCFVLFLAIYGNVSNADYTEDVVIVLGAGIHGETVSRPLARRLDTALEHWRENPDTYIITTGGLGERARITEAEAMARYLIARGVPESQILQENYSTSTYENLLFAKEILDEHFPNGFTATVVTSDFHIFRAVRTARSVGIDPTRTGAETDWYMWPASYLREMLSIANFWFFPNGSSD